jgi:hypothetical protein
MERMHAVIDLQRRLRELGYIADRPLAATLMLMDDLRRPLLLEGEAGAGKTEVAKVLAQLHATSPSATCSSDPCSTQSLESTPSYSSSTKSIAPTKLSRRTCWSCSRISNSPSPSSAP